MTYLLQLHIFKYLSIQIILLLIIAPHFGLSRCDYEQFGQDHTMCKYNTPACMIFHNGLNDEERQEIIRAHNEARQKIANGHQLNQPSASNMRQLGWSNELAMIAQRWAEQCTFSHDRNRRTHMFTHVGQNIFMSNSNKNKNSNADVKEAVQKWFNEVESPGFDANHINPFQFRQSVAHYTALVWANTDLIGCGFVHFQQSDRMYYKLTICNYAPGGNIKNDVMYKIGAQCTNCLNGCSKTYPGLCDFHSNGTYLDQINAPLTYNANPNLLNNDKPMEIRINGHSNFSDHEKDKSRK